jgi:hypothetical protein
MTSEALFFSLPRKTQNKIDSAFDLVAERKLSAKSAREPVAGVFIPESGGFIRDDKSDQFEGGFIREDDEPGGGFLRDDPDASNTLGRGLLPEGDDQQNDQIALSLIPAALQHLNLSPDDDEVLAVFRNAATGWTSSRDGTSDAQNSGGENQVVSREDWRSVCAVLLEHGSEGDDAQGSDIEMSGPRIESDGAAVSDEYQESAAEDEVGDDDDDYIEKPTTQRRTQRTVKWSPSASSLSLSPDSHPRKLTSRQRQACIDAYTLLFPTAPAEELLNQKIMIKDLQRVAKLLNEKLKTQEVGSHNAYRQFGIN